MGIGNLNESSLHKQLKSIIAKNTDHLEKEINGYCVDIFDGTQVYEIQTRNIKKLSKKIIAISPFYPVNIVYPIYVKKHILKLDDLHKLISKRLSPKKENEYKIFEELVYCPELIEFKNVSILLYLIEIEEIRCDNHKGSYRRRGVEIIDRNLLNIEDIVILKSKFDLMNLLEKIDPPISTKKISKSLSISLSVARKLIYTLKKLELIKQVSKKGNLIIYDLNNLQIDQSNTVQNH